MTVQQLSQLRYLKQEINVERERIMHLRSRAEYGARQYNRLHGGGTAGNRTAGGQLIDG